VTAGSAAITQPLVAALFNLYRTVDLRTARPGGAAAYRPKDLSEFGLPAVDMTGVTETTQEAIESIDFDAEGNDAGHCHDQAMHVDDIDGPQADSKYWMCDAESPTADAHLGSSTPGAAASPSADSLRLTRIGPSSPRKSASAGMDGAETTTTAGSTSASHGGESSWPPTSSKAGRLAQESVVVDSRGYTVAGYVLCAFLIVTLSTFVARETAAWCAVELIVFRDVMLAAAAIDIAVAQPAIVLLGVLWIWLTAEEDAPESDDDDDAENARDDDSYTRGVEPAEEAPSCLAKLLGGKGPELHPIHGQWRRVGRLDDAIPEVEDDTACPAST
jgi:hypothetical protein